MDDVVTIEQEAQAASAAPQLRTILLTDICDSTTLVEQLGDGGTAQFFREHDRLVLRLQQQWRGRLIDRSDGLLLLFERPIDGLGFALDYGRGLDEIGKLRHLRVRTRAGLHVGEVLTWRNSDEAVQLGAKPIEVEGLAKPIAARLMSIARPGQVLMSAVAEPLAHRAARELGERGQHMIWKSHGSWRFKGVAERQQIFEVGEPGVAPLRAPPNTAKAWRDVPRWRRPALLAAEAAVVAAVAVGGWFATRPPPAIAFNERDWVVVGDLRNLTGDTRLDDSLEQAFRISLEQSRFVNVLSDLKVRDSLTRMRLDSTALVDRGLAAQIAQRDGARAAILPTVSEVGGRLRFSVEVIDPQTQTTVYAHAADGKGEESILASIDTVTGALRADLGEAIAQIDKDSRPLPEVATDSIDALHAYALGQQSYAQGKFPEALRMYERAVGLDDEFALARLGEVRCHYSMEDIAAAKTALRGARRHGKALAPREAMYLDAWTAEVEMPSRALDKWRDMAILYPDFLPAHGNTALWLYAGNRFREAEPFARRTAVAQYDLATRGYDTLGRAQLAQGKFDDAARSFDEALALGYAYSMRRRLAVEAARGDRAEVERFMSKLDQGNPFNFIELTSYSIDSGNWSGAVAHSKRAMQLIEPEQEFVQRALMVPLAVSKWMAGHKDEGLQDVQTSIRRSLEVLGGDDGRNPLDDAGLALSAALVAQRMGDYSLSRQVAEEVSRNAALSGHHAIEALLTVLRANESTHAGRPEVAVKLLAPLVTGTEPYQLRVALMEAYAAAGEPEQALQNARWLRSERGRAYSELGFGQSLQALNVTDSRLAIRREAQLLEASGRPEAAKAAREDLKRAWPVDPPSDQSDD